MILLQINRSSDQEKIKGQRGRLQVQALEYVNSTKVIFGDISRTSALRPTSI